MATHCGEDAFLAVSAFYDAMRLSFGGSLEHLRDAARAAILRMPMPERTS